MTRRASLDVYCISIGWSMAAIMFSTKYLSSLSFDINAIHGCQPRITLFKRARFIFVVKTLEDWDRVENELIESNGRGEFEFFHWKILYDEQRYRDLYLSIVLLFFSRGSKYIRLAPIQHNSLPCDQNSSESYPVRKHEFLQIDLRG